ncbi:MAG: fatty acid kinase fatty acid binding subunit [Frankiaceae bacterium]|nr:fatty acid kinase fatty acid binding subunit [Frankiaceae bacterium]
MKIAVVTDSTAYLPAAVASGVTVVPLHVVLGDHSGLEGSEISPSDVAAALEARSPVTTSRPTPRSFTRAYADAVAAGATGIVSVHLSETLSSTIDAARIAAAVTEVPVEVVDSRGVGMAIGFAVLAAAHAGAQGLQAAAEAARRTAAETATFFSVETLEHLRRGGRITARQAILGTALSVKPILHVVDGSIELLEKVRTTSRAMVHLEDRVAQSAGERMVDIAVHHLRQEDRAQGLADRLRERIPGLRELYLAEVGAVVAAHTGPGLLGVVVAPAL